MRISLSLIQRTAFPSIYRGWWVVSVPFLAAAIGTGAGQYGFGIFIAPLEETFGWTRSQISASLSFTAVGSLIAPILGRIMDKYGTKHVITISLALTAVGFLLRPFMTELWHWYALSLLQYAGYTGASMLPAGKLVGLWFNRTRGRVMGITAMGNNFGGLVVPPMLGGILTLASWQGAYVALGVMSVLMVVYAALAVRDFPSVAELGDQFDETPGSSRDSPLLGGVAVKDALRSKAFYAIMISIVMGTFTYSAILPQIITHLVDQGVSLTIATTALSIFAIFGMIGKFVMGFIAERISARYTLMINLLGQAVFVAMMIWAGSPLIMWISVPLFGYFNGAFGALFQLVVQDAFGIRNYGSIMGIINMSSMISFGIGPLLAGFSYDITGSYEFVFATVAVMFAVGALSLTQARTQEAKLAVAR